MLDTTLQQTLVVCLAALLVAPAVGAAGVTGPSAPTADAVSTTGDETTTTDGNATEISSCTVIDEPGTYVLALNITDAAPDDGACIVVEAPNVTLDGAGHTIDGNASADAKVGVKVFTDPLPPTSIARNVTVRNLTVSDWSTAGVSYYDAPDGRVENVRAKGSDVQIRDGSEGTVVTETTVHDADLEGRQSDVTYRDNTITNGSLGAGGIGVTGVTVVGNELRNGSILAGPIHDSRIANNDVVGGGITVNDATNISIRNNTAEDVVLTSVDEIEVARNRPGENNAFGVSILLTDGNVTITENVVAGKDDGVYVADGGNLTITDNRIVNNGNGIYIERVSGALPPAAPECPRPESAVQVHGNVIANNSEYGIFYEGRGAIDATRNYWGADSGPSSPDDPDAPFVDPVTTRPADGAGDVVSERPDKSGVSNVHFDPYLPKEPVVGPDDADDERND